MYKNAALILILAMIAAVPSANAEGWYLGVQTSFSETDDILHDGRKSRYGPTAQRVPVREPSRYDYDVHVAQ